MVKLWRDGKRYWNTETGMFASKPEDKEKEPVKRPRKKSGAVTDRKE